MPRQELRNLQATPLWEQLTVDEKRFVREHYDSPDLTLLKRVQLILERAAPKSQVRGHLFLPPPELVLPFGKRHLKAVFFSNTKVHLSGRAFVNQRLRPVNMTLELCDQRWVFTGPGDRDTWHQEVEDAFNQWATAHPNFIRFADLAGTILKPSS